MNAELDPLWLAAIEDASLNASAPPQQLWLDGWLVRFSPGKAKRARSINPVAAGRTGTAAKLERAGALYREVGLPMLVRCTPFVQPETLDADLAALGMRRFDDTRVLVASLHQMSLDSPLPEGTRLVGVPGAEYAQQVGALRGSPPAQRHAHAERLAASPVPYRGFFLRDTTGNLLACAQFAREGGFVGLYDVFTAPAARNRRLAQALCAELLRRAAADGAHSAYLQVDADNAAAITVYSRLGFTQGYGYHYRSGEPDAA